MSGSGKGLIGLWLYRKGEEWTLKDHGPGVGGGVKGGSHPPALKLERGTTPAGGSQRTSLVFSLRNQVGGLARALQVFQDLGVNVVHIESRPKSSGVSGAAPGAGSGEYEILVDVECDDKRMEQLVSLLRREVACINLAAPHIVGDDIPPATPLSVSTSFDFGDMPWFPRKISDLDRAQNVIMYGSSDLDADHPQ